MTRVSLVHASSALLAVMIAIGDCSMTRAAPAGEVMRGRSSENSAPGILIANRGRRVIDSNQYVPPAPAGEIDNPDDGSGDSSNLPEPPAGPDFTVGEDIKAIEEDDEQQDDEAASEESLSSTDSTMTAELMIPEVVEIEMWCPVEVGVKINHRRTFQGGSHRRFCSPILAPVAEAGPAAQYRYTLEVRRPATNRRPAELCERIDLQLSAAWRAEIYVEEPCGCEVPRLQFEVHVFDAEGNEIAEHACSDQPGWRFLPGTNGSTSCPTTDDSVDASDARFDDGCLNGDCQTAHRSRAGESARGALTGDTKLSLKPQGWAHSAPRETTRRAAATGDGLPRSPAAITHGGSPPKNRPEPVDRPRSRSIATQDSPDRSIR